MTVQNNVGFVGTEPGFVTVLDNVSRALEFQSTHTPKETFDWFYDTVRNNKDEHLPADLSMDYKQVNPDYADFGNYNYAVVGKALGYPDWMVEYGAGWAQGKADKLSDWDAIIRALLDPVNKGDHSEDQYQIRKAIRDAEAAGISKIDPGIWDYLTKSLNAAWKEVRPYQPSVDDHDTRLHNYPLTNWYTDTKTRLSDPNSNSYRIVWIGGDPLALDLDGDGLETVAANGYSGALFDHNNDGIKTATGWINGDDGLLVRDINGDGIINNGSELFGDSTLLANGTNAHDGFVALRDIDSNADGKVDTSDTAFNELKIWRDLNQDGTSQEGELFTLADLGIQNLNTAANISLQNTPAGQQILAGSFTKTDGTTSTIADLTFRQETFYSEYIDHVEVPEELQHLPNIQGMGRLRDLREAAALSPALAEVLGQYAAAETRTEQKALIDQVLFEWAKTDPQYSDARITSINTIRLMTYDVASSNVIYLRVGQAVPNTVYDGKPLPVTYVDSGTQARTRVMDAVRGDRITNSLNEVFSSESANITRIYTSFAEAIYAEMLIQTRFEKYLNQIELSITETSISLDTSKITQMFEERIATDPLNGLTDLIEFNRYAGDMLTGTGWDGGEWRDLRNGYADNYLSERQRRSA